ncbi:PREDICTED: solute carrier family 35 member G2-like [Branchiostoma belcheri]|uniref:Solute carrier family 35 member G2-like n=1 Tax=Branchiostoma belcheri TaxID=7741 RepID=A0A6P4YLH8_BRABE|nr:PREDICTED: solute carrier family 35 member G2-like [Branchiostoma belcheri]
MAPGGDGEDSEKLEELFQDQNSDEDPEKDFDWCLWFKKQWGVAACLASGLFKGVVPAAFRYVEDRGYTEYQLNFFNDLLLASAGLCVAGCTETSLIPTTYKQARSLMFQGVGRFFAILCQFSAYRYLPPANAEIVMGPSGIVFTAILSLIFLQEIPTHATIFGSLWCIAGVVLIGYSGMINEVPSTTIDSHNVGLGMALAIVTALLFAMLSVDVKGLLASGTSTTMVLSYAYSIPTILAGVTAIFTSKTWLLEPTSAAVLCAGLLGKFGGTVLLYAGMKLVEVNAATALQQVNAFSGFWLQWAIIGFAPTIFDGFGLTCIFIGTVSIVIWEAIVRRKKDEYTKFLNQLDFNVTPPNNDS